MPIQECCGIEVGSLTMSKHNLLFVSGPAGAGKSTFLGMLEKGLLPSEVKRALPEGSEHWTIVDKDGCPKGSTTPLTSKMIRHYDTVAPFRKGIQEFKNHAALKMLERSSAPVVILMMLPIEQLLDQFGKIAEAVGVVSQDTADKLLGFRNQLIGLGKDVPNKPIKFFEENTEAAAVATANFNAVVAKGTIDVKAANVAVQESAQRLSDLKAAQVVAIGVSQRLTDSRLAEADATKKAAAANAAATPAIDPSAFFGKPFGPEQLLPDKAGFDKSIDEFSAKVLSGAKERTTILSDEATMQLALRQDPVC